MTESIDRADIKARATRKRIAERTGLGVDTIGESRLWRAVEPEIAALLAALEEAELRIARLKRVVARQERVIEGYEDSVYTDRAQSEVGALRLGMMRVAALHEPDADGVCPSCAEALGGDVVPVESPCPTLRILRAAFRPVDNERSAE